MVILTDHVRSQNKIISNNYIYYEMSINMCHCSYLIMLMQMGECSSDKNIVVNCSSVF